MPERRRSATTGRRSGHKQGGSFVESHGNPGVPRRTSATGNGYTDLREQQERLAITPSQTAEHQLKGRAATKALKSTAGDVMVDWGMKVGGGGKPVQGKHYWYRHGGGVQYVIAKPAKVLKLV